MYIYAYITLKANAVFLDLDSLHATAKSESNLQRNTLRFFCKGSFGSVQNTEPVYRIFIPVQDKPKKFPFYCYNGSIPEPNHEPPYTMQQP